MKITRNEDASTTRNLMLLSVVGILCLGGLLMVTTLTVLNNAETRIQAVVKQYNEKSELTVKMRSLARERTISLEKMLILRDSIDSAIEVDNFSKFGGEFAKARFRLNDLELTVDEKNLLGKIFVQVSVNVPIQREIIDLILEDEFDVARNRLLNESIPIQDEIYKLMTELIALQQEAANREIVKGESEYKSTVMVMVLLSITTGLIILFSSVRVVRHITKSENALSDEKEKAETTLHSIGDAVISTNNEGKIEYINKAAEVILDVKRNEISGKKLNEYAKIVLDKSSGESIDPIGAVLEKMKPVNSAGDTNLITIKHEIYGVEYSAAPIYDKNHLITGTVLVIKDVTKIRELSEELIYHARHDSLTGLLNRREMENRLEVLLKRYRKNHTEESCLCYLDVDQFKVINDTCGHAAGDEFLKQVATQIVEVTRDSDELSRMGGDEFSIILNNCKAKKAIQIMERLRKELQDNNFCWDDKCFRTTVSIGIVPIELNDGNVQDFISAADTACYVAKEEGRNQTHLLTASDDIAFKKKSELEWAQRLKQAIDNEQFVLYFQSIKSLAQNDTDLHGEILLRLIGEENNIIPPFSFIPAAERYNMMPEIDRYVIKHTFELLDEYSDFPEIKNGLISINLSAQSLCDKGFEDYITHQISKFRLTPENICFEITETAMISNMTKAVDLIESLQSRGCKFALDDFGSGLSSFAYLKNLPVDYLKIDGSFVKNIETNKLDFAMVSSVNQIGDILGIETIAEFVENTAIEDILRSIGVNHVQGYGIDRPRPFSEVLIEFTEENNNAATPSFQP